MPLLTRQPPTRRVGTQLITRTTPVTGAEGNRFLPTYQRKDRADVRANSL